MKLKIQIGGTDNSEPSDSEEEHEATPNARLVEIIEAFVKASMMNHIRRFDRSGHKLVQLEREEEDYKIVEKWFLTGLGASDATPHIVVGIRRFVPQDGAARARWQEFKERIKAMEELRGDANIRCAWHGTSKEGVVGILRNGFGRPSVGLEMAYGPGVCLAPQHCSHVSLKSCDADGDGLQHMVLCRVIMGRMEQVQPGSEHFHPSSEDFDSGVDDMQNPRLYVIFNAHMDTHIQAGYLVSFKLSPSQREHLAGLKNACSNVDVSMTSDQQANSTPNLIGGMCNSEPEEHEVISNACSVENKEAIAENVTLIPSVLRFDGLGDKLVRLKRKDEIHEKVLQSFLTGFGASVTPDSVLCIHHFVPTDGAALARLLKFREQTQITQMHRGDANLLWGWLGTSKEGVVGILRNGIGRIGGPSVGMAYGAGVYIASEHCSHLSVKFCDVDENDLQHMVYCLIIMGRMEQVQWGSEQFQPSSEDFDSSVDDIQNPRLYVTRTTHMNTHIHPEYLVTFKLSPSLRKHLAGLNNICGNVDVSITNDQRATSTPNLEERG
ncbi:hypothetical protein MRB53_001447 [Persea americana]|uniref:Uncharacterized protein n=1 Tax=Persea americana TaxID=3435 RepID=A0ACC2MRV7_PERAE|nr:hypothetical protein MRB53_001447 [Persea americana]